MIDRLFKVVALIVITFLSISFGYFLGLKTALDKYDRKLLEVKDLIKKNYYLDINEQRLTTSSINGILSSLDPYCEYYTKEEWDEYSKVHIEAQFGGVGIIVEMDTDGIPKILTPIEDTPAFSANILPGDKILEVDAKPVKDLTLQQIVKMIRGNPGTKVTLKIKRQDEPTFEVALERAIVKINPVKAKSLESGLIGYIRISGFSGRMTEDFFDKKANEFIQAGAKALVLDLRFNPGGLLTEAILLSDRFLSDSKIVTEQYRQQDRNKTYEAKKGDFLESIPLAILINEGSASASEIFAAAMKDHKRAILVGTKTWGKGLIQGTFKLSDESWMKLTVARYLTPNGVPIARDEQKFVEPDYTVEMAADEYAKLKERWARESILKSNDKQDQNGFTDRQLQKAVELLLERIKDAK